MVGHWQVYGRSQGSVVHLLTVAFAVQIRIGEDTCHGGASAYFLLGGNTKFAILVGLGHMNSGKCAEKHAEHDGNISFLNR